MDFGGSILHINSYLECEKVKRSIRLIRNSAYKSYQGKLETHSCFELFSLLNREEKHTLHEAINVEIKCNHFISFK